MTRTTYHAPRTPKTNGVCLQSRQSIEGAVTRPTGELLSVADLTPGVWFDLNSGSDADSVPVRVVSTAPSRREGRIRVEFVTMGGENGEAHLQSDAVLAVMASFDFEDEEG